MNEQARRKAFDAYVPARKGRWYKVGRAFENAYMRFEIVMDIGSYRDLHRHRMMTQERQTFSTHHGFATPVELVEAGLAAPFDEAIERAAQLFPKAGIGGSRPGAICRAAGLPNAVLPVAELQTIVLGGRAANRVAGSSGLPFYRAREVSADQGEVSPDCQLHAGGYERLRDRAKGNGRDGFWKKRSGSWRNFGRNGEDLRAVSPGQASLWQQHSYDSISKPSSAPSSSSFV